MIHHRTIIEVVTFVWGIGHTPCLFEPVHVSCILSNVAMHCIGQTITTTLTGQSSWLLRKRSPFSVNFITARCYAESSYATVCCLSVTFRYCDHIGWNTSKIITQQNSLRLLLGLTPIICSRSALSMEVIPCAVVTSFIWSVLYVCSIFYK